MNLKRKFDNYQPQPQLPPNSTVITNIHKIVSVHSPCSLDVLLNRYSTYCPKYLALFHKHIFLMNRTCTYNNLNSSYRYLYYCSYLFHEPDHIIYNASRFHYSSNYYVAASIENSTILINYHDYYCEEQHFDYNIYDPFKSLIKFTKHVNHDKNVVECVSKLATITMSKNDKEGIESIIEHYRKERMGFIKLLIMCFKHSNKLTVLYNVPNLRKLILKMMVTSHVLENLIKMAPSSNEDYIVDKFNKLYSDLNKYKLN